MPTPDQIEFALTKVKDWPTFQSLLIDVLGWNIEDAPTAEEITFGWDEKDLRAANLDKKLIGGKVRQFPPADGCPWGIFLLEFNFEAPFADTASGRGMTETLRKVLRGLVPSKRKASNLASFKREHILFICTHKYQFFRFAYFKEPPEGSKTAPLSSFGWQPGTPARTACTHNLPALEWPRNTKNAAAWLSTWTDAFNVERVTKRFYTDYAAEFEKLRSAVKPLRGEDQKMFTQALMNRLLFLRFIERKGWLTPPTATDDEGSKDYLRNLFVAGGYRGKSFYAGRLKKLFFEALAVEGKQQSEAVGKVPFLNGGLFDASELDKQVEDIPDAAFARLLGRDGLLYRYNFTVQESTPLDIEVAVDPEMLGKVFEELVTGRHESGSYYTPRPVVSFMCREALKGYLAETTKIEATNIADFVDNHDVSSITLDGAKKINQALDDVRAVDPACGSGAYLLGLLHEIVALYLLLYSDKLKADARELHRIKLDIIERNLYGVDIDPFATNIAMLRLWLSLTVDSTEPLALPNLDFKIETGNALTGPDPQEKPELLIRLRLDERARQLAILKGQYMRAHGTEKKMLRQVIRHDQQELASLLQSLSPGAIDWRVQFCEVFFSQRAGFDIALANPPYIRQELIKDQKPELKKVFGAHYSGTADLYVFFYLRALQLLARDGMLVFISSNKWFRARYGEKLRKVFATSARVHVILDFHDLPVFETAIAYPMIFVASKSTPQVGETPLLAEPTALGPPYPDIDRVVRKYGVRLPSSALAKNGDWYLGGSGSANMLLRLRTAGKPLGDYVGHRIYRGVLTGLNEAFVVDRVVKDRLVKEHKSSSEILKPFVRGRDIKRWRVESEDLYLIKIESSENRNHAWSEKTGRDAEKSFETAYPAVHKHLHAFRDALKERYDQGRFFWELRSCDYWHEFEKPKIIAPAIQNDVHYAPDSARFYTNDKTSIIVSDDAEYLLSILNSRVSWWLTRQLFASRQSGFFEFKPMYLSQIPIPGAEPAEQATIRAIVRCLVTLYHQMEQSSEGHVGRDALMSAYFERLLNGLVYELYFRGELGEVRLFDLIKIERPPVLESSARQSLDGIRVYFESLYRSEHPVRAKLDKLQTLDVVRTIEAQP